MPEGPEVHTIADWLASQIIGFALINVEYSTSSRYSKLKASYDEEGNPVVDEDGEEVRVEVGLPGRDELLTMLPATVVDIDAKGKKIIFMLENAALQVIFLVSSLMMEGKWTWEATKHSDLWLTLESPEGDVKNLYFTDSRHFGIFEIVLSQNDLFTRLKDVGPDLLTDVVTEAEWLKKIRNGRIKNLKIGRFVMEQKYFSGIGNYLRAEILYAARISPHRPLAALSDAEALRIFHESRRLIRESYDGQGATLATYRNPHGGKGEFKVIVYNKTHDPLGNKVITEDIGDKRSTHWVPALQV